MSDLQIFVRNLGRHPEGYWIAEAAAPIGDGPLRYYPVHRKWGSWMYGHGMEQRDIRPEAAAELQRQVKKLEKREALHEAKIGASPVEADELRSEMETA